MLVDDDDDGAWQDTQWAHKPMIPILSLDCDDGTHTMWDAEQELHDPLMISTEKALPISSLPLLSTTWKWLEIIPKGLFVSFSSFMHGT